MAGQMSIPEWLTHPGAFYRRVRESAVAWSLAFNALRLAYGLILLPLVLNRFSKPELGMYYVLLNLAALVPLIDFGFGPTIGRFVSYAMGGAESIQAQGIARPGSRSGPNYELLWQLLRTTQRLYRYLALLVLVLLGVLGTYTVELRIDELASPLVVRAAWGVTLLWALLDIYSSWWATCLRSMNEVTAAARYAIVSMVLRLLVAAALLGAGAGLLSLPAAGVLGCLVLRHFSRRRCLMLLAGHPRPEQVDLRGHLKTIWPNTWRMGVQFMSGYLTVSANTFICLQVLGLQANARYGLSVQLVTFVYGMAMVWTIVRWPAIGQSLAQHDMPSVRRLLWSRIWLQALSYVVGCGLLLLLGPWLLGRFGGGKEMLPLGWVALLMLNSLFEAQFITWGTLISMQNRMTYLWPTVATNALSLAISLGLIHFTQLGLGALVLGPLLAGVVFNYWYWPLYAAKDIKTTLPAFMFLGPGYERPSAGGSSASGTANHEILR